MIWQFRETRRERSKGQVKEPLSLLVAESISPGAKELLRDERVGYYDSGGILYLPAPGACLYVAKPPPKTLAKSVRFLFSGRRAQVLHALLVQHQDWFGGSGSNADAAIADLGASVVNEGANLAIIEAKSPSELLFRVRVGGIWLASPVQVYHDLLRGEGCAKEMAEHLRKERISF
mgnify:CR=1 FL=1